MSEHLPTVSAKELIRILRECGWTQLRQKGSHIVMRKTGYPQGVSIPNHRELSTGTLRSLLKQTEITVEEFRKLL